MTIHNVTISVILDTDDSGTREFLSDIMTTAIAGGINYWASILSYDESAATVVLADTEEGATPEALLILDIDVLAQGIKVVLEAHPPFYDPNDTHSQCQDVPFLSAYWASVMRSAVLALDAGEIDADAADVIVQAALFGEIRYG